MSQAIRRIFISISIPVILLTFSSCAGLNKHLESPTVRLANIEVKEIKLLEATLNIQLRVLNPNDTSIIAKGINCDLEINDIHLASGVSNVDIEIPAFGTAIIPVEVFSSALGIVKNVIELRDKKSFKYKIKGRILFEGGSFMPSYVRFESEEDLNIKGLMERQD